jgi:hypothetical protein
MQVTNLLSRYLDKSPINRRSESADAAGSQQPVDIPQNLLSPGKSTQAAQEVLANYNVNQITPRQFSQMLQALREIGAISEQQFQDLSTIRAELDAQGIEPDEEVDLVKFCEDRLADAREVNAEPALVTAMEKRLESLRKFALIQSAPEMAGWNSFA